MANKNTKKNANTEITFEVSKKIGVISKKDKSSLELRIVAWNGGEPKFDIRSWYTNKDGEERCGKGISLTKEELANLVKLLGEL